MRAQPEPLPSALEIVLGVLNVGGQAVTMLISGAASCGATLISARHRFLIVDLGGLLCAFVVNAINGPGGCRIWRRRIEAAARV
jgi:purine-binding chemotaxis protein CheW